LCADALDPVITKLPTHVLQTLPPRVDRGGVVSRYV
jgi:hypothetical protein